jgi:PKD domain
MLRRTLVALLAVLWVPQAHALARPGVTFKVFQFPADRIPRIDGDPSDWAIVPDSYAIGLSQLINTEAPRGQPTPRKRDDLDVKVKLGWVKGLNRIYVLYQAYNRSWQFSRSDIRSDIFELVVDGDASGGPLVPIYERDVWRRKYEGQMSQIDPRISPSEEYFHFAGDQAQNYHVFTPPGDKDWAMVFGCAQYVKRLPYANHAFRYHFRSGQPGDLVLEFYITPFDYAGCEGPERAVESHLQENEIIGISFAVIDYQNADANKRQFWNLSHIQTFFGNASQLCAFRLMPLEKRFRKPIQSRFSLRVIDMSRRLVYFKDESVGKVTSWRWNFGDGTSSSERDPIHRYADAHPGHPSTYTVVLRVQGPAGTSRRAKVWAVHLSG